MNLMIISFMVSFISGCKGNKTETTEASIHPTKDLIKMHKKFAFTYNSVSNVIYVNVEHERPTSLNCEITTKEKPGIVWYKDGKPLIERSFRFFYNSNIRKKYVLRFNGLMVTDIGKYKCIVGNNEDAITKTFDLKLKDNSRSSSELRLSSLTPGNTTLNLGDRIKLVCRATGSANTPVFFQWDHRFPTTDRELVNWEDSTGGTYKVSTLKIDQCSGRSMVEVVDFQRRDVGEYVCVVFNGRTYVTKSTWLSVKDSTPVSSMSPLAISLLVIFTIAIAATFVFFIVIWFIRRSRRRRKRTHSYHYESGNSDSLMPPGG